MNRTSPRQVLAHLLLPTGRSGPQNFSKIEKIECILSIPDTYRLQYDLFIALGDLAGWIEALKEKVQKSKRIGRKDVFVSEN